jgi:hypothetical protein
MVAVTHSCGPKISARNSAEKSARITTIVTAHMGLGLPEMKIAGAGPGDHNTW